MLLRFQQWMLNLERLLVWQVARWCVEVLVVKKGNQVSEVVDEVPNSFYCQPPPTTRKIPNVVASDNVLCGYLRAGTMIHLLPSIHSNKLILILCE